MDWDKDKIRRREKEGERRERERKRERERERERENQARDDIKGELKVINAVEMLHVVERKRSKPTNTGCRGGFSYSLSANCNFPLTRDMTTFWVLFALLITFRHARRFVCACFPRKQATDHNHSTNRNRSSEQTNI